MLIRTKSNRCKCSSDLFSVGNTYYTCISCKTRYSKDNKYGTIRTFKKDEMRRYGLEGVIQK
jgi:tRNA(Ile2) C34 agmatinyltransferase TiaS